MNALQNKTKAHLGLILANLVWAMNYPFYKMIMPQYMSPYALATLAVSIAAILALLSFFFVPVERVQRKGDIVKFVGAAVLMGVAKKLFLMVGIQHTSPIDASIIATLGPILVLVISVFFLIDRFTPMKIVGMVIGLAGALVVILSNSGTTAATAKLGGDAIVFLGIVSSSFSMVWLKDLIMRYKPITLLRWMYPLAALMLLPFGLSSVIHTDFAAIPPHIWWVIAYAVLLPSFGPNYLLIFSLHYVKPTISSVYFYLQPVIAPGLSVALGMDKLSWDRGLASIAVFVGVLLVVNAYKNHPSAPRHGGE